MVCGVTEHDVEQDDAHRWVGSFTRQPGQSQRRVNHRMWPPAGERVVAEVQHHVTGRRRCRIDVSFAGEGGYSTLRGPVAATRSPWPRRRACRRRTGREELLVPTPAPVPAPAPARATRANGASGSRGRGRRPRQRPSGRDSPARPTRIARRTRRCGPGLEPARPPTDPVVWRARRSAPSPGPRPARPAPRSSRGRRRQPTGPAHQPRAPR